MRNSGKTGVEFVREYEAGLVRAVESADLEAVGRAVEVLREARARGGTCLCAGMAGARRRPRIL